MKRPGLTPARLVAAAADLADEAGLASVTVSALARHFAVQPASVYSHINGLDHLLDETTALALTELADQLAETLPGKSGRAALIAFANTHRDYARAHPGRWQATHRRISADAPGVAPATRISRAARAIVQGYGLSATDEVHAVRLLGSAVDGFLTLESGGGFDHSLPPASDSFARIIDAVDSSLRHWPAAASTTPTD